MTKCVGGVSLPVHSQQATTSDRGYTSALARAAAPVFLLALSACVEKPAIAVDSYCSIKPTELIDMRDPNLQRLIPVNQGAVLTGDDNHRKFCLGGAGRMGPR